MSLVNRFNKPHESWKKMRRECKSWDEGEWFMKENSELAPYALMSYGIY